MANTWMELIPDKTSNDTEFLLKYTKPSLGFVVNKVISTETANLLKMAFDAGKEEALSEIRKALGL